MFQAITIKYLPPTNTKPARIKAFCDAGHIIVSWHSTEATSTDGKYKEVAQMLVNKLGWLPADDNMYSPIVGGWTKDCAVFVMPVKE